MTAPKDYDIFDDDLFSLLSDEQADNKRTAVRYIRTDISASIGTTVFFFFSKKIPVKLIDISSKGAAIKSKKRIRAKKIILNLVFADKKVFTIPAKIIYRGSHFKYGLKFNRYDNELGNHMLETQSDLLFK